MTKSKKHKHQENTPCFVFGSVIMTAKGAKLVEELVVGDLVYTLDNGFQKVLWVGKAKAKKYVSIRNTKVSLNHRILLDDKFIFAKNVKDAVIVYAPVEVCHFMTAQHDIVLVDWVLSETFNPGKWILSQLPEKEKEEIYAIFPHLKDGKYIPLARTMV